MAKTSKKSVFTLVQNNDVEKMSKETIAMLKESYVRIGTKDFSPTAIVKKNHVALKKWFEIIRLYQTCEHIEIVTSADIGLVERYSLMYADYKLLLRAKAEIDKMCRTALSNSKLCNEHKIDTKINTKARLLLQMETELFLTPLSKSRAIPRNKPKPKKDKVSKFFN